MKHPCHEFRQRLEALLAGRPNPPGLTELGWHEHLLGCHPCRDLLEQEEALELVLASLPDPKLPPDLSRRLLARLRTGDALTLEALLAMDEVSVPAGLASRVRAGIAVARQERSLDALLDRDGSVDVPEGLAGRVLAGLELERQRDRLTPLMPLMPLTPLSPGPRPLRRASSSRALLMKMAAALLVCAAGAAAWMSQGGDDDSGQDEQLVSRGDPTAAAEATDEEVIANLSELLYWDSVEALDPVERDLLTRLDLIDEALLDTEGS